MTQADIAFLLSLENNTVVSRIENRRHSPSLHTLVSYCELFESTPAELLPDLASSIREKLFTNAAALLNLNQRPSSALDLRRHSSLERIVRSCGRM